MNASDILNLNDLQTKVVRVKEWDRDITIKELGLDDGLKMFDLVRDVDESPSMAAEDIAQVVAWGVVDPETLERVFSDDDVPALARKNMKVLMFLYEEVMSLSGKDAAKN